MGQSVANEKMSSPSAKERSSLTKCSLETRGSVSACRLEGDSVFRTCLFYVERFSVRSQSLFPPSIFEKAVACKNVIEP